MFPNGKLIKRFFNDIATGQPKEEGSNATLNPAPSSIFKMVGFRRIPCRRSLATSVDVDRITLRNSWPLLFSESGTRHERIWDEARANLGRDTTESGRRCGRVWVEIRPRLGRRSLTNMEFDLLELLHRVSPGVAMLLARCGGFI